MTMFKIRVLDTLLASYGNEPFSRFDAAVALDTTEGNISRTLYNLVKFGKLIEVSELTYTLA